jgi:alanine racemase
MKFSALKEICKGQELQLPRDRSITYLITDSRKILASEESVFFAIDGERHDGHQYISSLYENGVRQFIIEKQIDLSAFPEASFLLVSSSLNALQQIAKTHRSRFSIPVIGITGSNGKTVIKEWLYQLLSPEFNVVKNPGSYNSQLGVPLSVWQLQPYHQLAIFEAGISKTGEMEILESIIQPTIGLFTNIGPAHEEGFKNTEEKIQEKIKLFKKAEAIIYCKDHPSAKQMEDAFANKKLISWGKNSSAKILVQTKNATSEITWENKKSVIEFPFRDSASLENAHHCIALLLHLGIPIETIQARIYQLKSISMRMELKQGINNCQLIDDTYNNDLAGLKISLDFLSGQQKKNKTLILSDVLQSGLSAEELINHIEGLVIKTDVSSLFLIGAEFSKKKDGWRKFSGKISFFSSTEDFLQNIKRDDFRDEIILIKGARPFRFERIVQLLQKKVHGTVMEIDLGAMVHNLNYFKSKLKPGVKLMAMVKAFAYGSGSEEVASLLQYHRVDYLGVAYADEGIDLRKNRIVLPIMVMNPSEESFASLLEYNLEPEIFNLRMLRSLVDFLNGRSIKIHFKIETGMHRLGFDEKDLQEAIALLRENQNIKMASVFSHLAGADDSQHDDFTRQQATQFEKLSSRLVNEISIDPKPLRHLLNTSAILRFPDLQFEMVRLGIGLYGVNPTSEKNNSLQPVATLKTVISQIKNIQSGETVGYGRKGKATHHMRIATIAIGYADGFSRAFSQRKGIVLIHGKRAPVIGNVCMDMTMIDITDVDAKEGDEVILFGKDLPIHEVADRISTIPYEILTNTSERVKRVFWSEGI